MLLNSLHLTKHGNFNFCVLQVAEEPPMNYKIFKITLPVPAMLFSTLLATLSQLSGCASIVSGSTQVVSVDTPGCPSASCELINDKGKWYISNTPGTTSITRAYGSLNITCRKDDNAIGNQTVNSTTKGMAFGNILLGGIIGAGVDIGTGAAYDYPTTISVPMTCPQKIERIVTSASFGKVTTEGIRLGIRVDNLTDAMATAMGLKNTEGVIVSFVSESSVAQLIGIKIGHILLELNGKQIIDSEWLARELARTDSHNELVFTVYANNKHITLRKGYNTL